MRSGACETVEDPDVSVSGGRQSVMLMPAAVVSVSVSRMRILTLQMLIPSHLSRAPRSGARAGGVKRGIAPHCAARATMDSGVAQVTAGCRAQASGQIKS